MENERAKKLIAKYLEGNCTPEEKSIVESWYLKETADIQDEIEDPDYSAIEQELWADIIAENKKKHPFKRSIYWFAAAAILIISAGLYFGTSPIQSIKQNGVPDFTKTDIRPGSNKALLTLADGSKIILDDA